MYISLCENSQGHPDNVSFMQFSTKIDGFEQKDSQGFENSYNSYEQYPLEIFFHLHHLPKLYFGFKLVNKAISLFFTFLSNVVRNEHCLISLDKECQISGSPMSYRSRR